MTRLGGGGEPVAAVEGKRVAVHAGGVAADVAMPWRDADRFVPILEDFLSSTTPGHVPAAHWRELLINAPPDD